MDIVATRHANTAAIRDAPRRSLFMATFKLINKESCELMKRSYKFAYLLYLSALCARFEQRPNAKTKELPGETKPGFF